MTNEEKEHILKYILSLDIDHDHKDYVDTFERFVGVDSTNLTSGATIELFNSIREELARLNKKVWGVILLLKQRGLIEEEK